ncbi:MAG: polysaccharide biosynthesis protein [Desulfovibrio sp.]
MYFNWRNPKLYAMVLADMALFALALLGAYLVRFDFEIPPVYLSQYLRVLPLVLAIKLPFYFVFGMYRGMWRYTSLDDALRLFRVSVVQSLAVVAAVAYVFRFTGFPRSVFALDWLFALVLAGGLRLAIRMGFTLVSSGGLRFWRERRNVLVVGAGRAAELVTRELSGNAGLGYQLIGFVDDDPAKRGRTLHGKPVLGRVEELPELVEHYKVQEIFIAVSRASAAQMRSIVEVCKGTGLKHRILPAMGEIMDGRVGIKQLRDVDYHDLLGRSEVLIDNEGIQGLLSGRTVLVTGCGGSIGSELCRQIVRYKPGKLLLFDASEYNLYQIQMQLHWEYGFHDYVTLLGNLNDDSLLERLFAGHRPEIVFHAAAYKHVPMLEENPWQAVENNIVGTRALMRVAAHHEVRRFVTVSTDKAVRPTNVMGASKRVTELLMKRHQDTRTLFMAVRFGNVIGSSGSVMPLFRQQIEKGGPVTVTHPEVTRYFMSISEAAQLILQAGTMGRRGGEIFILDMGEPVRIADMAADLIRLSGKTPGRDIEIVFTGLRSGEKLYEELITEGEDVVRTEHEKIRVLRSTTEQAPCDCDLLEETIEKLRVAAREHDGERIRLLLRTLVSEYIPAG